MKYRLLFKDNATKEVAVVTVDVPDFLENYQLVGSAKTVVVYEKATTECDKTMQIANNEVAPPVKFISNVPGTARLTTYKGKILVSYRRGSDTRNQTTPTSVCINDTVKQEFFNDSRDEPEQFVIYKKDNPALFNKWFTYIEREYKRQQRVAMGQH